MKILLSIFDGIVDSVQFFKATSFMSLVISEPKYEG